MRYLTRHQTPLGPRWAIEGNFLPRQFSLSLLLELPRAGIVELLKTIPVDESIGEAPILPPLDPDQEVWASGVTYLRSRQAREAESNVADVYQRVYEAERPELFFKATGWRVVGHKMPIHIREDSHWNVPEPEITLVINRYGEIVGFCAGNDVSSRDIEGANPLYLPQAKVYNRSCALGPGIQIVEVDQVKDVPVEVEIVRAGQSVFKGETSSTQMKRSLEELVAYLIRELDFPYGVFLMTGTGIVPPDDFTLQVGDVVQITVATLVLENVVE